MTGTTMTTPTTVKLDGNCLARNFLLVAFAAAVSVVSAHGWPGSILGAIAMVAFAALTWLDRGRLKGSIARFLVIAEGLALASMTIDPGALNITLAWAFATMLVLHVNGDTLANLGATLVRSAWLGSTAVPASISGAIRFGLSPQGGAMRDSLRLERLVLPLLASFTLLMLLVQANPLIEQAFDALSLGWLLEFLFSSAGTAFLMALFLVWPLAHVRNTVLGTAAAPVNEAAPSWHARYLGAASVLMTLLLLNTLLGIQNLLDLLFMWSGKALPDNMTYAAYAHRGAYPLIATALLAGLLVIVALWPGTATAARRSIRMLVYVWIAQNVFLVASTMDRTFAYVDAYGMTELRLAALIWMALVAWGLVLVAVRIAGNRSNQWLVNANIVSAAALLIFSSFFDHRACVANWNVNTITTRLEKSPFLDLRYLRELGIPALPAFRQLEQAIRAASPDSLQPLWQDLLRPISYERLTLESELAGEQQDWRRWNLRHSLIAPAMAEPMPTR